MLDGAPGGRRGAPGAGRWTWTWTRCRRPRTPQPAERGAARGARRPAWRPPCSGSGSDGASPSLAMPSARPSAARTSSLCPRRYRYAAPARAARSPAVGAAGPRDAAAGGARRSWLRAARGRAQLAARASLERGCGTPRPLAAERRAPRCERLLQARAAARRGGDRGGAGQGGALPRIELRAQAASARRRPSTGSCPSCCG